MSLDQFPLFLKLVAMSFFALLPVINPIGTSLVIHSMTRSLTDSEYRILSFKIATYTVGFLLALLILGQFILKLFGLSIPSVQIGGGLVLMTIGWKLLGNEDNSDADKSEAAKSVSNVNGKEFYPLTFPITAGPGGISVILTLSAHSAKGYTKSLFMNYIAAGLGVLAMGCCVFYCYVYLPRLTSRLSKSGLNALSKLLAFVILCIGVEILRNGISSSFWHQS